MKIGIISDTHGCADTWQFVMERFFADEDMILHAGDILYHGPRNEIPAEYKPKKLAELINSADTPVLAVKGNCDAEVDDMVLDIPLTQEYQHVQIDGLRIIVNHGHHLPEEKQIALAKQEGAALVITGHTHVATMTKKDGVLLLNPGSPKMTKREDGRCTVAMIEDRTVTIYDIHTAEKIAVETI